MKFLTKTQQKVSETIMFAAIIAILVTGFLTLGFFASEPTIGHSQTEVATSTFEIQQTITAESSFSTEPADVTMNGSIAGITGGTASGTTEFVVLTNNAAGYFVEIDFYDNGTPEAMAGDLSGSQAIRDYTSSTNIPTYGFTPDAGAQFAYTVTSDSPSDTASNFIHNGAACANAGGQSSGSAAGSCWMAPSTTPYEIVNRGATASVGATSTLTFYVDVPSNPVPIPAAETYTATATLTLFLP